VLGVLAVFTDRPHRFDNDEKRVCATLANLGAVALQNARLYARVFQSEETLRKQEQLTTLGLLAAEIAHEIRNPLTVLKLLHGGLGMDFAAEDPRRTDLRVIGEKLDQLESIVTRVLNFAKAPTSLHSRWSLSDIIADTLVLVRPKLAQAKAQMDSAQRRIPQNAANLRRVTDVLSKTEYTAPFDGVITNLPVREGETVVIGIQNAPGSTLMTIADVSVITAEVKVDETDIVNVKLGQTAEVSIDAIPKQRFKGIVTEIGNNAILRSTGVSTAQSTSSSQEAKDFKVVVTIQDPPGNLLPGLSTTARITTASRTNAMAIPIQALTIRQRSELEPEKKSKEATVQAAALTKGNPKEELQGVFVLKNKKEAVFVPVTTGISGTTDIEVTNGLKEGDEIVTGSYKVLRTLRNGASVKVDNTTASKKEES